MGGVSFFGLRLLRAKVFSSCCLGQYFCGSIIRKTMTFRAIDIRVLDHNIKPQAYLDFYIDNSLHHLFKAHGFLVILFYLDFNRKLKLFSEIANYSELIGGSDRVNIYQNKLEVLKVRYSVLSLFLLVLEFSLNLFQILLIKAPKYSRSL